MTKLRTTLDIIPDHVVRLVNPAYLEFLGIQDEPSRVGQSLLEFKQTWQDFDEHGNPKKITEMPLAMALRGTEVKNIVYFVRGKDGTDRWELVSASPIRNQFGEIIAAYAVFPDITLQKETEEALRKSQETLVRITSSIDDAIYSIDGQTGEFAYLSQTFERKFGYSASDIEQMGGRWSFLRQVIRGEDHLKVDPVLNELRKRTNEKMPVWEHWWRCKNGKLLFIEDRSVATYDGDRLVRIDGVLRDITDRKQAEEEIQLRAQLLDNSADSIFLHDMAGNLIFMNEKAYKDRDYTREELLKINLHDLDVPEFAKMIESRIVKLKKAGEAKFESAHLRKDGSIIPVDVRVRMIKVGDRDLILSACTDITERKRAEEQIKADIKEKDVLLKEIHHRVKNNMQIISSLLNLQSMQIKDKTAQQGLMDCQNRIRSIALIHENLYSFENFARIEFDHYIKTLAVHLFQIYSVDPNRIALEMDLENISLAIDLAIPCGLVINELISNALKHAFPQNRKGKIRIIFFRTDRGEIRLKIGDDGIGVPPGFDLHKAESLGLHLVDILVKDQLHGEISTVLKKGVVFNLRFKETKP